MKLPGALMLLDGSDNSLAAFAKFADPLQGGNGKVFLALPPDLRPTALPPLCRALPDTVVPLVRLSGKGNLPNLDCLAAAVGQPLAGAYLDDDAVAATAHLGAGIPGRILVGLPPLADDPCFRLGDRIALARSYFAEPERLIMDLGKLDPALGTVQEVARLSAHLASPTAHNPEPRLPTGGWLDRKAVHDLTDALAMTLRPPLQASISLAEAFGIVIRALATPADAEWLWYPQSGPAAHPQTQELITNAGAIRQAAVRDAAALAPRVPNVVPVDGFPIAAAAFLQTAAKIIRDQAPDDAVVRIPAVPNTDFAATLAVLRQLPKALRPACQAGLTTRTWETARI